MKSLNFLPNVITAFGLTCGLFIVFRVIMAITRLDTYELLCSSVLLLMLAGLADFLDGAIARVVRAESEFGIIFDSLADSISFGVAPSVLFLKGLAVIPATCYSFFAIVGAMLYTLCGVLRLARFNVHTSTRVGKGTHFVGLPIPAAAACAVSANLFLYYIDDQWGIAIPHRARIILLTILMVGLGCMMVSKWEFPSLKALHFRLPSLFLIFLAVLIAVFVLHGIFYYLPGIFFLCAFGYLLFGSVATLNKTLFAKGKQSPKGPSSNNDH